MDITIHTDGSYETQRRVGGWAAILTSGKHKRVLRGSDPNTTISRMELIAVIQGLKALKLPNQTVIIYTDSNYVAQGVNEWMTGWQAKGWRTAKGDPVANTDLWQELVNLLNQHRVVVRWQSRAANAEVDKLAVAARRQCVGG